MASTYAIRSVSTAETFNKLTISCWFRGHADGTQRNFWGIYDNSDNNRFFGLYYSSNGSLYGYWKQDGSLIFTLGTTQKFRDPGSYYHFVMSVDTTLATAADRVKFYLNGQRITSFEDSLETITQSKNITLLNGNNGRMQWGGGKISGTQYYWKGSMSHCHMCVGYAYDASAFGSTDATTGEWKINSSPSVQYGTNGGFWFKDGNQLTDSSTNSNTLTASGTITKTQDCPSNVFATLNPLFGAGGSYATMSNGNTTSYTSSLGVAGTSTLGASSGKYYAEFKHSACTSNGPDEGAIGVCDTYFISNNTNLGGSSSPGYQEYSLGNWGMRNTNGRFFYSSGGAKYTADNQHAGWSLGDIIMLGLDCDNKRLYLGKNGYWLSSNTWSSSTPSQYLTLDPTNFEDNYHFACGDSSGTNVSTWQCNFGNGTFGTTAVSSNSGSGYSATGSLGIFQYQPPTGYTALCTKGLNL